MFGTEPDRLDLGRYRPGLTRSRSRWGSSLQDQGSRLAVGLDWEPPSRSEDPTPGIRSGSADPHLDLLLCSSRRDNIANIEAEFRGPRYSAVHGVVNGTFGSRTSYLQSMDLVLVGWHGCIGEDLASPTGLVVLVTE